MSHLSSSGLSKRTTQAPLYPRSQALYPGGAHNGGGGHTPLYPSSGSGSPFAPDLSSSARSQTPIGGNGGSYGAHRSLESLEGQSEERLEGLIGKVRLLKDITVGIGSEVKDGTFELESMNDIFASTSTAIKGTMRRMTTMSRKVGGQWCWLMLFLVLVGWLFVGLWFVRR